MLTAKDYTQECNNIGEEISSKFGIKVQWVAYSGGVPGLASERMKPDRYEEIKQGLTEMFGEPVEMKPWHPSHTKGKPPLQFKLTPEMEHLKADHVNIVHMMQRKDKQYFFLTVM